MEWLTETRLPGHYGCWRIDFRHGYHSSRVKGDEEQVARQSGEIFRWSSNCTLVAVRPRVLAELEVRVIANIRVKVKRVQYLQWIERSESSGERPRFE